MAYRKYSQELKDQAVHDYEQTGDAQAVADKLGVNKKLIYQWKSAANSKPAKDAEALIRKLKRKNAELEEEKQILKEIIKKTIQVMPLD